MTKVDHPLIVYNKNKRVVIFQKIRFLMKRHLDVILSAC